jgi:acylphosphatase
MKTVQVKITGLVQGVGYRAWTADAARARKLSGWVRNRRDGSVEALISGEANAVDDLLGYLWQGPFDSRVERVETAPAADPMQLGFRVLPTS